MDTVTAAFCYAIGDDEEAQQRVIGMAISGAIDGVVGARGVCDDILETAYGTGIKSIDFDDGFKGLNLDESSDLFKKPTDNRIRDNIDFTWKLRGEYVTLDGVNVQQVSYVKRNSTELKKLRCEFNSTTRKAFLENLGDSVERLRNAGFSESDILKIQNGRVPEGWQVHHKLPLDDSGINSFENLILIKNEPYHKVITNYQNSISRYMKIGETQIVQWPMPRGNVYPL